MNTEKKDFLLMMGETEASNLTLSERYDRIRLFRQLDADEMVNSRKVLPTRSFAEKTAPRASNAVMHLVKK